ncbi:uncharacterized protein EDB91DRAFT_1235773 [Suillus paluster]|uniref:uncharacterized protein n=1 Tax=Suillus paluster TaxID=48578 RepID=UPI001B86FABB|nr:uncharacterized protein EDB91DRAFT_1235773 [Suillus paluster]KAG1747748.1 hypothetical protein EDB91DRAFT_1235773 [Suillus paluster]
MSYGQFQVNSAPQPVRPISLRCPLNGWINNGGWIDGGIDPPHFYLTHGECQQALYYHIGLMEHPQMPKIERDRIWEPAAPVMLLPALPIVVNAVTETTPLPPVAETTPILPLAETAPILPVAEIALAPPVGHLVSILMNFSLQAQGPVTCGSKVVKKKSKLIKSDYIVLKGITHVDFITAYLSIHGLSDQFSPGVHSGPPFKLYWTGSAKFLDASGGKGGVTTIDNNHQFSVAMGTLMKKNKTICQAGVEFDVDEMDGYRICNADHFLEQDQLHGTIILQLKKKWPCVQHQGEHGDVGFCYVSIWAATIAAADATKHEPPSTIDFDGVRDGYLLESKPCGRHKTHGQAVIPALSPHPAAGSELHTCLWDFTEVSGIDIIICEDALMALELTPDVIPDVPVARLCEFTDIVEGRIRKFQAYCKTVKVVLKGESQVRCSEENQRRLS